MQSLAHVHVHVACACACACVPSKEREFHLWSPASDHCCCCSANGRHPRAMGAPESVLRSEAARATQERTLAVQEST
eukprot:7386550-Prymnesium_polylepis.1